MKLLRIISASILIAVSAGLAWGAPSAPGSISLSVSPTKIYKTVTKVFWKYDTTFGPLSVTNTGDRRVDVRVYATGLSHDLDGNAIFWSNDEKWSIADQLMISPNRFSLDPGKTKTVDCSIILKKDRSWGGYSTIFVEATPSGGDSGSVVTAGRLGVLLLVTFPGSHVYNARLEDYTVSCGLNSTPQFSFVYKNMGDIHHTPSGRLTVKNQEGKSMGTIIFNGQTVLPDNSRRFSYKDLPGVPKLKPGKYTAELVVNIGGGQTRSVTEVFHVVDYAT